MIISKCKKVIVISSLIFSVGVLAVPVDQGCGCKATCSSVAEKVKEPSWWNWLTKQNSAQFHFFDLIELLNKDENDLSAKHNDFDDEQQQVKS
jgi:hypothetical protein